MTKRDLIAIVAKRARLTKKAAAEAVNAVFEEIAKALSRGEKAKIAGFGVFFTKLFAAKEIVFIGRGEKRKIPSRRLPRFTPGAALKRAVK